MVLLALRKHVETVSSIFPTENLKFDGVISVPSTVQ